MDLNRSSATASILPGKQWWLLHLAALYQKLETSSTGLNGDKL